VYLFNAAQPASGLVHITRQKRNETQSTGEIEFTIAGQGNSSRVIAPQQIELLLTPSVSASDGDGDLQAG
jgi:hypothetical protein